MKKKIRNVISRSLILILILLSSTTYAHSGRTDAKGGHKDKNNLSGLGYYHYHCGGHPAHLHPDGVCPYDGKTNTETRSTSNKSNEKVTKPITEDDYRVKEEKTPIVAESIIINENISEIEVGEEIKLTTTISPNNTYNKDIKWRSTDYSVLVVNSEGIVRGLKEGTASIEVVTSNNKKDSIEIHVKERKKETEETNEIPKEENDKEEISKENDNIILPMGAAAIGGTSYIIYKNRKKKE